MPEEILKYQFIDQLAQLFFVKKIYLFGSRARKDHKPFSDIDLAIDGDIDAKKWLQVEAIVEDADTLLKIDCVNLNNADDELKTKILNEGVLLYESKD